MRLRYLLILLFFGWILASIIHPEPDECPDKSIPILGAPC